MRLKKSLICAKDDRSMHSMMGILITVMALVFLTGCASNLESKPDAAISKKKTVKTVASKPDASAGMFRAAASSDSLTITNKNQIITLAERSSGRVAALNAVARFVVVDYALNPLPPLNMVLGVYRQGVKVGEVRITGPAEHDNIAADILTGDIQVGDEVRRD